MYLDEQGLKELLEAPPHVVDSLVIGPMGHAYRLSDHTVELYCTSYNNSLPVAKWTDIGTLPLGFRPIHEITAPCTTGNQGEARCLIKTNGAVAIFNYGSQPQTNTYFSYSYKTGDPIRQNPTIT